MSLMIASDLHGSKYYTKKLLDQFFKINPKKLVLLGDLYYHGPRNPFATEYNPLETCQLLNSIAKDLVVIKGNCDSEVDRMISNFPFLSHYKIRINNKTFYFTHGHKYNIDNPPKTEFDILVYGHQHIPFVTNKNGKIYANPGSISLPKNNSKHSFMLIENNCILLKDLENNLLLKYDL